MMQTRRPPPPRGRAPALLAVLGALAAAAPAAAVGQTPTCARNLEAEVVAFDQVLWYNRLGARDPGGMMFALIQDVQPGSSGSLSPGSAVLRPDFIEQLLLLPEERMDAMLRKASNLEPRVFSARPDVFLWETRALKWQLRAFGSLKLYNGDQALFGYLSWSESPLVEQIVGPAVKER